MRKATLALSLPLKSARQSRAEISSLGSQSVRYVNEMRALNVLFREGGMSRAALARSLGLNRSTTGNIIGHLIEDGLVAERSNIGHLDADYRTGRPGITIELERERVTFVGAEIGVDRLTVVAIDLRGEVIANKSLVFPTATRSPESTSDALVALIMETLPYRPRPMKLGGIGIAIPALIAEGMVREAPLIGWHDVLLATLLRQRLPAEMAEGLPILVENDANAFAMGETYTGTSNRSDVVAFFLIDSGAGGGLVVGGRLFRGASGVAGEFGHLQMGGTGFVVDAGKPGRLESYIGKAAILNRYKMRGGPHDANMDTLLSALTDDDACARETALEWAHWLSIGLMHVINILNPGLIIIGGSVGALYEHVSKTVEATLSLELLPGQVAPRVELSGFGDEGAAFGCAFLMHQRMFSIDEEILPLTFSMSHQAT